MLVETVSSPGLSIKVPRAETKQSQLIIPHNAKAARNGFWSRFGPAQPTQRVQKIKIKNKKSKQQQNEYKTNADTK